jgi:putative endonuclease
MERGGCVYILTNKNRTTLYTGVTSDLYSRIYQHKSFYFSKSFTSKYNCTLLVYYCFYPTIEEAIAAEKQIKGGSRRKKLDKIDAFNPEWKDLFFELDK